MSSELTTRRPREYEIRKKIKAEYNGKVISTATGNRLHFPADPEDEDSDHSVCHITRRTNRRRRKDLAVFPENYSVEWCTPCLEEAFDIELINVKAEQKEPLETLQEHKQKLYDR